MIPSEASSFVDKRRAGRHSQDVSTKGHECALDFARFRRAQEPTTFDRMPYLLATVDKDRSREQSSCVPGQVHDQSVNL